VSASRKASDRRRRRIEDDPVVRGGVLASVQVAPDAAHPQSANDAVGPDHPHAVAGARLEQTLFGVLDVDEHLPRSRRRAGVQVDDVDGLAGEVGDAAQVGGRAARADVDAAGEERARLDGAHVR
jgi:hypothetical protein